MKIEYYESQNIDDSFYYLFIDGEQMESLREFFNRIKLASVEIDFTEAWDLSGK